MSKVRPPLKTHGGKFYSCDWIIENFPSDYKEMTYCEFFCGGSSVLLNKEPSKEEMINDLDLGVVSVFKALRDEPDELIDRLNNIPYTEENFLKAKEESETCIGDYMDRAVNEYVLRRMSRGGMKKVFSWSQRSRGGKPGDQNAWETMLRKLPYISQRIKNVTILNEDFRELSKVWDDESILLYLDPPYLPETRTAKSVYAKEMNAQDHIDLLNYAKNARSKIIISGYSSTLYNKYLKDWTVVAKEVANHSGQNSKKGKRIELLWMNY